MSHAPVAAPRSSRFDGASMLLVVLGLLFLIPSRLKIAALGGLGAPFFLLSAVALGWWVLHQLSRADLGHGCRRQPVRIALGLVLASVSVSYALSLVRFAEGEERSTAFLSFAYLASWSGLLLLAHDGVPDLARLRRVVRVLVAGAAFVALVGLAQRVTGQLLIDRISIPGLVATQSLGELGLRSGFARPMGTTLHPIEFGALLAMALPLAFNQALVEVGRSRWWRWSLVVLIALGLSLSIARSALIGAAVGLAVLVPRWPRRVRLGAVLAITGSALLLFVAVPGLLGTLTRMFTGIAGDDSAQSRVNAYPIAARFIAHSPWFGRGLGTFLPRYQIFDNQYLLLLIEIGVIGTVAFLGLLVSGIRAARAARLHVGEAADVQLMQSLVAAASVGTISCAFYDGFSFPVASSVLFIVVGLCGAARRLTASELSAGPASLSSPAPLDVATAGAEPARPPATADDRGRARRARSGR